MQPWQSIFSPLASARKLRHALEAIFVLRNGSLNEPNSQHLSIHPRTRLLLYSALRRLKADSDANSEFLFHVVDLLHSVASSRPQPPIDLEESPNDRTMIITALRTLTLILSSLQSAVHLTSTSPALFTSIRYLPLLVDTAPITACLDYLYAHLSHPPMVKAFLLHSKYAKYPKVTCHIITVGAAGGNDDC